MELGNIVFGHSRGEHEVDRDLYEEIFEPLFDELAKDSEWGEWSTIDVDNKLFSVEPYDWGAECTCGFEQEVDAWWKDKGHPDTCFMVRARAYDNQLFAEYPASLSNPGNVNIRTALMEKFCAENNKPYLGCLVNCDCGLDETTGKHFEDRDHNLDCRLIQPNFLYKPTGFHIMWYKYPFRDSYSNQGLSVEELTAIVNKCTAWMRENAD